ncbi:MAG: GDP-mannose 4,6-dehydratase [Candidatus Hydrothermarchaeaceae archaeon]
MWKDKNVLITGISGFVGSYLAKHLVKLHSNVYGLVSRKADGAPRKNLVDREVYNDVNLVEGDLTDISSIAFALDKSEPDVVFHLGAQSFIPRSFSHPLETMNSNCAGTANLLEAVRIKELDPTVVFAGTSEEYGLVISSDVQYKRVLKKYKSIFPEPEKIPELPISEKSPLRPMSPYAVSKVYGDYLMRDYYHSYGMKTVVSRGFNHEGAGRGIMFVTSVIASQVMKYKFGEINKITIGNVNAFRDWSHITDVVRGYCLLAKKGRYGDVYNQGSQRTNSVMTYILSSLEKAGYHPEKIETLKHSKRMENPAKRDNSVIFGKNFEKTKIDVALLKDRLEFQLKDRGVIVHTDKGKVKVEFDRDRFRPAEVPILMADTNKIQKIGFKVTHRLEDIIQDQLNFYMKAENR